MLDVIHRLYGVALNDPAGIWDQIFRICGGVVDSEIGGFIVTDHQQPVDLSRLIGLDTEAASEVLREFGPDADYLHLASLRQAAGTTLVGSRLPGGQVLEDSPLYNAIAHPIGLRYVLGGVIENNDRLFSALWYWAPAGHADFDCQAEDALRSLLPHVRQSLMLQRRIGRSGEPGAEPGADLTIATFMESRHGILILDGKDQVLFINPEGERIAAAADGMNLRNRRISAMDPGLEAIFTTTLADANRLGQGLVSAPLRPLRIPRPSGLLDYEVVVIPVTDDRQRAILPPGASLILAITDPAAFANVGFMRLRGYGLTNAEARLCQALLQTGSLSDAADRIGITAATARSHVKHVFAKLGVRSQIQLVQVLMAGFPMAMNEKNRGVSRS